jgi:hypothetical protein
LTHGRRDRVCEAFHVRGHGFEGCRSVQIHVFDPKIADGGVKLTVGSLEGLIVEERGIQESVHAHRGTLVKPPDAIFRITCQLEPGRDSVPYRVVDSHRHGSVIAVVVRRVAIAPTSVTQCRFRNEVV